ncbi:Ctr-domain-containing protein [Xylaria intraflava]|nr:Ctr-domain-containing protein [Xylaria intraflava]
MSSMNTQMDMGGGMGGTDMGAMNMSGMDMGGMGGMSDASSKPCKISMLWNWNTVDACFLSEKWQVRSEGGFAALCIGVIFIVMLLELLRHAAKQYDLYLIDQKKKQAALAAQNENPPNASASPTAGPKEQEVVTQAPVTASTPFRPVIYQQAIRALLHTLQFATAYWIMLLAMYYNGYIIICIFIGAFIGSFIFQWERLQYQSDAATNQGAYHATVCCD